MIVKKIDDKTYDVRDCEVIFKNFRGLKSSYNKNGDMSFCLKIRDKDIADFFRNEGINVPLLKKKSEDEADSWKIQIKVRMGFDKEGKQTGARVKLILNGRVTELKPDTVHMIDKYKVIDSARLEFRRWEYDKENEPGKYSLYLNNGAFWVTKDWFDSIGDEEEAEGGLILDDSDDIFEDPPF